MYRHLILVISYISGGKTHSLNHCSYVIFLLSYGCSPHGGRIHPRSWGLAWVQSFWNYSSVQETLYWLVPIYALFFWDSVRNFSTSNKLEGKRRKQEITWNKSNLFSYLSQNALLNSSHNTGMTPKLVHQVSVCTFLSLCYISGYSLWEICFLVSLRVNSFMRGRRPAGQY